MVRIQHQKKITNPLTTLNNSVTLVTVHTHTQEKTMNDYVKQMQDAAQMIADQLKAAIPTVKTNKNGFEIRTQVLEMAQNQLWQDYHAKWGQFETSISKEGKEVVTKVEMPQVPGAEAVLEAAEKFYNFVNNTKNKE